MQQKPSPPKITSFLLIICQLLACLLAKIVAVFLIKSRRVKLHAADIKDGPVLLAANHQRVADPFMIIAAMPWKVFRKLAPVRFMVANGYMRSPLRPVLLALGCFPARRIADNPKSGLDYATALVQLGTTILVFPEGKRTQPGETVPRTGVSVLAELPGVELIPVHLHWQKSRVEITIERPYKATGHSSVEIMAKIYALANQS